jgi:hypothetical protein
VQRGQQQQQGQAAWDTEVLSVVQKQMQQIESHWQDCCWAAGDSPKACIGIHAEDPVPTACKMAQHKNWQHMCVLQLQHFVTAPMARSNSPNACEHASAKD